MQPWRLWLISEQFATVKCGIYSSMGDVCIIKQYFAKLCFQYPVHSRYLGLHYHRITRTVTRTTANYSQLLLDRSRGRNEDHVHSWLAHTWENRAGLKCVWVIGPRQVSCVFYLKPQEFLVVLRFFIKLALSQKMTILCASGTDPDPTFDLSQDVKSLDWIQPPTTANTKYLWVISLRFFSLWIVIFLQDKEFRGLNLKGVGLGCFYTHNQRWSL